MRRFELTDYEWVAIRPMLPNKARGVPRANDRRVLNGSFWVLAFRCAVVRISGRSNISALSQHNGDRKSGEGEGRSTS